MNIWNLNVSPTASISCCNCRNGEGRSQAELCVVSKTVSQLKFKFCIPQIWQFLYYPVMLVCPTKWTDNSVSTKSDFWQSKLLLLQACVRHESGKPWMNVISGGTFKWNAWIFLRQPCLKLSEIPHLTNHECTFSFCYLPLSSMAFFAYKTYFEWI